MLSKRKIKASALDEILSFTYPKLYTGRCWYIGFYAFDPSQRAMRRKRIKINSVGTSTQKKRFAAQVCHKLAEKLENGWNPWIEAESSNAYKSFKEVLNLYRMFINRQLEEGVLRLSTIQGYQSSSRILEEWNEKQPNPITYIYQFDHQLCVRFLDYVYMGRGNSPVTRNNHLAFLRSFSTFLVQRMFVKVKPTDGIQNFSKSNLKKERTVISAADMKRLHEWLMAKNKSFLLVCYFLYYMLIRPREIAKLKLRDINVAKQTVFIDASISKNKKSGCVTINQSVLELMLDLGYFNAPADYYIFSENFMPGAKPISERHYRYYWVTYVVPALNFPPTYKFYSLKDSGITEMLRSMDTLSVKEQARHSSLTITDAYTPYDVRSANPSLTNYNRKD